MTEPIEREAYTPTEVAEAIGVDEVTVQRWLQAGVMPGKKVGRIWLVSVAGLRNWLNGEEEADAGRGDDLPQAGRPLGGREEQRTEGSEADTGQVLPFTGGGNPGAQRAPRKRQRRASIANGWGLPHLVGPRRAQHQAADS